MRMFPTEALPVGLIVLLDNKYKRLYGNQSNALSRAQADQFFALKVRNNKYKGLYGNCMIALLEHRQPISDFESVSSCDVITNRRVYITIFQMHCQSKCTYVVVRNEKYKNAYCLDI